MLTKLTYWDADAKWTSWIIFELTFEVLVPYPHLIYLSSSNIVKVFKNLFFVNYNYPPTDRSTKSLSTFQQPSIYLIRKGRFLPEDFD